MSPARRRLPGPSKAKRARRLGCIMKKKELSGRNSNQTSPATMAGAGWLQNPNKASLHHRVASVPWHPPTRIAVQGAVRCRRRHEGHDGLADRQQRPRGRPCRLQNIQADFARLRPRHNQETPSSSMKVGPSHRAFTTVQASNYKSHIGIERSSEPEDLHRHHRSCSFTRCMLIQSARN